MAEVRPVVASPPLDLKDVLLRGRWQEAVFLTYSFDLPFFESYVLPTLVMNGCKSITVAACASWLPDPIRTWSQAGDIREAGESYTLSAVSVPGVFHPKLLLAAGNAGGVVLVGSGNISEYGMATGGELFTLVEWEGDDVPSLARESWQLSRDIGRHLSVDRTFADRVDALGRLASGFSSPVVENALVHNLTEPILDQLIRVLVDGAVEEVIVWSPFTDRLLGALDALVSRTRPDRLVLGVQPDVTKLDGARLAELQARHPQVAWEVRALRQGVGMRTGMIHAKGILACLRTGEQVALIGSPNLSTPAMLRTATDGNFELAVLHRSPDLRERIFGADSVVDLGEIADISRLTWQEDPTTTEAHGVPMALALLGARHDGAWLEVEIRGIPAPQTEILLDGTTSLALTRVNEALGAPLTHGHAPRTAELVWEGGRSGPVVIHNLPRLASMRRGAESRPHTPLSALDYGPDSDLLALLDELAQLAIVSIHDVGRTIGGRRAPTPEEEAAEAEGQAPVIQLDDIDFSRIRQHPRAHAYDRGSDSLDTPRIVLWLDEVVRQFESLRERQLMRAVQPIPTDEVDEEPSDDVEPPERRQWPTSRRVRVLVRNRLLRGVTGMADPRFWRMIDPAWMAMNYGLWLGVLDRLWTRALTPTPILLAEDLAPLTSDLLAGYWGDDRHIGYFPQLDEATRRSSAVLLAHHQVDALTVAACIRLLGSVGEIAETAPFVVGTYVKVAEPLGLMTEEVVERALVFLDRADEPPGPQALRLFTAASHFSWDRFADNLAWRHHLGSASVLPTLPGRGRFISGHVLAVGGSDDLPVSATTMRVFGEWAEEVRKRDPSRSVIQMAWGTNLILIYDVAAKEVLARPGQSDGAMTRQVLATGVAPEDIGTISISESLTATA